MSRARRAWFLFGLAIAGGLILWFVVGTVIRYPVPTLGAAAVAFALTRKSLPFTAVEDALHDVHHSVAQALRTVWVPLAIAVGCAYALLELVFVGGGAFCTVAAAVYAADQVLGWTVRSEWRRRSVRRSGPVVVEGTIVS